MSDVLVEEELRGMAADYALGALDADGRAAFERHLAEGCDACAEELRGFEETVALVALAAAPAAPPPSVRARLLSRVAHDVRGGGGCEETRGGGRGDAAAGRHAPSQFVGLADFLVVREGEGEWAETSDPGVSVKLLFVDKERDTVTTLVRLAPGSSISAHRHLGVEQCLVLDGVIRSGQTTLGAGDFNCALPGSVHEEIHTEGGALLLIVSPESYETLAPAAAPPPSPRA